MHRWEFSRRRVGVNAPSWLTFELFRPFFDGADSAISPILARGPALAARLFAARDPFAARQAMLMPASFRRLLVEESRLTAYRVDRPTELADALASPVWRSMTGAHRRHAELDDVDRAGLVSWLNAACLPEAVLDVVPADHPAAACADPLTGLAQLGRAQALLQREGLTAATTAAFAPLVDAPAPTLAHMQACGVWSYLLARHAAGWAAAGDHARQARRLLDEIADGLPAFDRALWRSRIPLRETMLAERGEDLDTAWELIEQARATHADLTPATPEQAGVAAELRRRIIDRQVEIAVKRGDLTAEQATIAEGLALDPYCVKIRMQAAQAAERRGELGEALAGYLLAARLGPFGTAFALLHAASCAGRLNADEVARVLSERAFRAAPRSTRTNAALVKACLTTGDAPLAEVVRRPAEGYATNWHYRMYGGWFNLGPSGSPCLYAGNPQRAYDFAVAGEYPLVDLQRVMPPVFRTNLTHEAGLPEFDVDRPEKLPPALRTPAWEQLCDWVAGFAHADPQRQLLTCKLLFHLGFNRLVLELLPDRPAASLREPAEFHQYVVRNIARYADTAGRGRPVPPTSRLEMIDQPECPLYLRFTGATLAVIYAGRETKSVEDAARWRDIAAGYLDDVLASDELTEFDKVMVHSRFYRGVAFLPFLRGDLSVLVSEMELAEKYARAVVAETPWQEFLRRENLHACLETRAKEALRLGDPGLAHRRYVEALAIDPYHPMSNIELADSLRKQERYAEAADSYLRAARLGPYGTAIAYHMAGECFRRAGDEVLAEDCFLQALRVDPYAVSAARGWDRTAGAATAALAREYTDGLHAWGERRRARATAPTPEPVS